MENRSAERIVLPGPALIRSIARDQVGCEAVLRDISAAGAYFFAWSPLDEGERIFLHLRCAIGDDTLALSFTGTVVRVEENGTAGSRGVAIEFCDFTEAAYGAAA